MPDARFRLPPGLPWLIEDSDTPRLPLEEVPGWDQLRATFRPGITRFEMEKWMTVPNPDLEGPGGEPMCPVDWLLARHPIEPVVELAGHVGEPI